MSETVAPETEGLEAGQLSARDLAVDHTMAPTPHSCTAAGR